MFPSCHLWLVLSFTCQTLPSPSFLPLNCRLPDAPCHLFWPGVLEICQWFGSDSPLCFTVHPLGGLFQCHAISCRCHGSEARLFLSSDTKIKAHVSAVLNIAGWKSAQHRQLNLDKTERLFLTERTFHHKWQDFCQVCRNTQHYNPLWSQTEVTTLHCRLELEKIYLASAQFRRFFRSKHFLQHNKLFPNVSCILMQRLFGQWKVTVWSQRTMESCCFHPNKSINKKRGFTIISQFNTPGFNTVKRIC